MLEKLKTLLNLHEKAMPPQEGSDYKSEHTTNVRDSFNLYNAYSLFECVNRGVNMVADCASAIPIDVGDKLEGYVPVFKKLYPTYRANNLHNLLNVAPNPDQDRSELLNGLVIDLLLTGNAYLYFDGASLWRLPVIYMKVKAGPIRLVEEYIYTPNSEEIRFKPDEVIRIKYGSATNPYIGTSRLAAALQSLSIIDKMNTYQRNYFKNSTVLGIVLHSKNLLGDRTKKRYAKELEAFRPDTGANKPIILDGDVTLDNLSKQTNKDLDYDTSLRAREYRVLQAIGIPPVLLDPGTASAINDNLKMFYQLTVLPLMDKIVFALERYFGIDLKLVLSEIPAMLPDDKSRAQSLQTLVNSGILTRNEAREELRYEASDEEFADSLILPVNIAGSANDSSQGGRPTNET